jgi:hypothetical protein
MFYVSYLIALYGILKNYETLTHNEYLNGVLSFGCLSAKQNKQPYPKLGEPLSFLNVKQNR